MSHRVIATDELSIEARERVDEICLEFEDGWLAGESPELDEFLGRVAERERTALLAELLPIDIEYRAPLGTVPRQEEYVQRFPRHHEVVEQAFRRARAGQSLSFSAGQLIGRYVVERSLGRGAFGEIYLARDEMLQRQVALKLASRRSETAVARMAHEARMVAQLEHPAVVPMYDVGQFDDGSVYLVMHYVEGCSLDRAADPPWSPPDVVRLVARIAEALDAAHQKGLVHRDLKPANILLDRKGLAYLTDFGLALDEREQREHVGECAGTPHYMAPEQFAGLSHRLDGRADIWSLGVIMYQLLTGRLPFGGDTTDVLRDEVQHRQPKPPRQVSPEIPAALERICLRCLAKNPTERYATAADLAVELHELDSRSGVFQRRAWLAAATVVVLAAAAVVGWNRSPRTLDGSLEVLVWKQAGGRPSQRLAETGALPLEPGDQIRLDVALSHPAYVYLVWIDSQGAAMPVYPWADGDWQRPAARHSSTRALALPPTSDEGWTMEADSFGTESVLLLVRSTPLPDEVRVERLLAGVPSIPSSDTERLARSRNGVLVFAKQREPRSPDLKRAQQINDPVLARHAMLDQRLRPYFEYVEVLSFECASQPMESRSPR